MTRTRKRIAILAVLTPVLGVLLAVVGANWAEAHSLHADCTKVWSGPNDSTFTSSSPAGVVIPGGGSVTWAQVGANSISGTFATGEHGSAHRPDDCQTTTTTVPKTTTTAVPTTTTIQEVTTSTPTTAPQTTVPATEPTTPGTTSPDTTVPSTPAPSTTGSPTRTAPSTTSARALPSTL